VNVIPPQEGFPTFRELRRLARVRLDALEFGARVSYADLTHALGVPADGHRGRAAVLAAGRDLLRDARPRLLVNVRNEGYQIARPNEHADVSKRRHALLNRGLARNHAIVTHVLMEWEGWTDAERAVLIEQQTRTALALIASRKVANPRTAIPAGAAVQVPTGRELVRLLTRPPRRAEG
jgi:hypothetical protein